MKTNYSQNFIVSTILIIIGISIYANSFKVPFYFDDSDTVQNPVIQIENISLSTLSDALNSSILKSRPVSNLSFALNYYFCGDRVQSYHLFNTFIHIISAITLFSFISITLFLPVNLTLFKHRFLISFFTAFLWLSHPLATESVTYIVQRMNSLAAMFYILSLFLYAKGRTLQTDDNRKYAQRQSYCFFIISLLSGLLAIGSKENAATLPIAIFIYEWYFFQNLNAKWLKKRLSIIAAIIIVIFSIGWFYSGGNIAGMIFDGYAGRDFTLWQRSLTELRVIIYYIGLIIYPSPDRLFLDHSFPLSYSILQPITTLLAGIIFLIICTIGIIFAKKERVISFCIFWFILNLAMESSFIPLEIIFEHRTYLPSMFFILIFVIILFRIINRTKVVSLIFICISTLFCYWTIQRNAAWLDPIFFWQKTLLKYPENSRVHLNLGVEFLKAKHLSEAEHHFNEALQIKPAFPLALSNLGKVKLLSGDYHQAEIIIRKALQLSPSHVPARLNLAELLYETGRLNEAQQHYQILHDRYPEYSIPNMRLGQLFLNANKPEKALPLLERALPKHPDDALVLRTVAIANMQLGNIMASIDYFEKLLSTNTTDVSTLLNLAQLYNQNGYAIKAEQYYQKAYSIQPYFIPIAYNYGNLLLRNSKFSKAEQAYRSFLLQANLIKDAHNNLGLAYIGMNKLDDALQQFQKVLQIDPNNKIAENNLAMIKEEISRHSNK